MAGPVELPLYNNMGVSEIRRYLTGALIIGECYLFEGVYIRLRQGTCGTTSGAAEGTLRDRGQSGSLLPAAVLAHLPKRSKAAVAAPPIALTYPRTISIGSIRRWQVRRRR